MPRQRILVEDPLRKPHQPVETEVHAGGRQAEKDAQLGEVRHDLGSVPAAFDDGGRAPPGRHPVAVAQRPH